VYLLKACPRCHGDIYFDGDRHDPFIRCVQCGYIKEMTNSPEHYIQAILSETERSEVKRRVKRAKHPSLPVPIE